LRDTARYVPLDVPSLRTCPSAVVLALISAVPGPASATTLTDRGVTSTGGSTVVVHHVGAPSTVERGG
jgi:hypothetical protein